MADSKITALASIGTGTDPANDPLVIVDVSDTSMAASGTTKKVTLNNLLACSPTATLASATITGDLTVRTNKLAVTSTGVGAGTATPLYPLHLVGEFGLEEASPAGTGSKLRFIGDATKYNFRIGKQLNVSNGFEITPSTTVGGTTFSNPVYTVTNDGIHTFLDGAGGTRMTLNATGLGVGVTPSAKLHVSEANLYAPSLTWNQSCTAIIRGENGQVAFGSDSASPYGLWAQVRTVSNSSRAFLINPLGGGLLVGTRDGSASWGTALTISTDSGTTRWAVGPYGTASNFVISASGSGGVYLNGTAATSWTAVSDERLKDIIEPISNAVAKVGSLRSVIGKFKSDDTNTRRSFLIAQDVQAVLPEAVDASNPDKLGVAYSEVIPLLVAAIKELTARVQTLETR